MSEDLDYPVKEIINRARKGRKAIYPFANEYKFSIYGSPIYEKTKRFYTLDDIIILPPQFTPLRLEKAIELASREPTFFDVETEAMVGGFKTSFPLIQSSMGSPDDWNRVAPYSAKACAELGLICGIGENVATTWGYDKRTNSGQPCFMERLLAYLENLDGKYGGIVIQQNEEDAYNELWNRVYSDKRLDKYIEEGKIAFEIKGGQGAKAGMGGEKIVDRETAKRLKQKYTIYPDPDVVEAEFYERHSSPDIFTEEILEKRIKKLKNDYPRVKIWFKTGPYRDLGRVIEISSKAGADCIVIDGKEGGTGMSPTVALKDLGLPTLVCLKAIHEAKLKGVETSMVISGRLYDGSHLVKALSLKADAVAMGRPFLIASYAYRFSEYIIEKELYKNRFLRLLLSRMNFPDKKSVKFIKNFMESVKVESQMLTSAVGKYNLRDLSEEDIGALNEDVAKMFGIRYVYQY
jgi:hypothetical protein